MHIRDDDFNLYIRGQLTEDQTSSLKSHLDECGSCRNKMAEVVKSVVRAKGAELSPAQERNLKPRERRRFPRVPTEETGQLRVLSPVSLSRLDVELVNLSRGGMMLQVPEPIDPGALVQIHVKDLIVLAEVRYRIPAAKGFRIGVQIRSVFPKP